MSKGAQLDYEPCPICKEIKNSAGMQRHVNSHKRTALDIELDTQSSCNHLTTDVKEIDDYAWGMGSNGEYDVYDAVKSVLVCRNCGITLEAEYDGEFDE